MVNKGFSKYGLRALDSLTDWFPTVVPQLFQNIFLATGGSNVVNNIVQRKYAKKLNAVKRFDKLLVLVDVNIGDAVIMQSTVHALKSRFPEAQIDYVCNAAASFLVSGMPDVHTVFNLYTQFGKPSPDDMDVLRGIIHREQYNVIFNFCGFIDPGELNATGFVINAYVPWASEIANRWRGGKGKLHLTFAADSILRTLTSSSKEIYQPIIRGSSVYLSHSAILEARAFLASYGLLNVYPLVMLHADAPFQWTQIPIAVQNRFLHEVLNEQTARKILVSCGNARNDIGAAVLRGIPERLLDHVIVVPKMSIAAHAALIDACDVFVSGDTGNMHIAAARKIPVDKTDTMRNATCVVGIYGATDSRMSGYDSHLPDHISGEQDAPSKVFVAAAPCRNISCIDKPGKSCREVRCFDGLEGGPIAAYVNAVLRNKYGRTQSILDTAEHH